MLEGKETGHKDRVTSSVFAAMHTSCSSFSFLACLTYKLWQYWRKSLLLLH